MLVPSSTSLRNEISAFTDIAGVSATITAWMLMLWRVPAVRSDIFTNPYLNLFTGYTLSILALAALILILTAR